MKLSSRFMLDGLFLLAGAFLTVASMTWAAGTAGWTAFGVSTGVAVLATASAALGRSLTRRAGHGLLALLGIWSLVAAVAFSGPALTWLVFADAIAVGVVALADLTVHEATTERVVHQLEIRETSRDEALA
jgi:hypothetical protein